MNETRYFSIHGRRHGTSPRHAVLRPRGWSARPAKRITPGPRRRPAPTPASCAAELTCTSWYLAAAERLAPGSGLHRQHRHARKASDEGERDTAGCVGIGRDPRSCSDPSLTCVIACVHRCRRVVVPELSGEAARPRAAGRAAGEAERAPRAARRRGRPTPTPRSTRATRGGRALGSRHVGYGRARGAPWTSNPKPGPELIHVP